MQKQITLSIPCVSLNPAHKYVTQSNIWDNQRLGPLTDRRIAHYAALGRYGPDYKEKFLARQAEKKQKQQLRKTNGVSRSQHKRDVRALLDSLFV